MKSRLYLETTIPSYLTSRPSRDLIIAGHQQVTRDWWEKRRGDFQIYISQLVLDVTWNCVHIANAVIVKALASICRQHGCECPVICTPEEVLGE